MPNTQRRDPAVRASRVLHRDTVQVLRNPVPIGDSPPGGDDVPVELIREGGVIRQIRVTCSCGQTIALDCHYPGDQQGGAARTDVL